MKWLLWLYTAIKMTTFQSKWESIVSCTDHGHMMSRFHIFSDKIITKTQNSIKMFEKLFEKVFCRNAKAKTREAQ